MCVSILTSFNLLQFCTSNKNKILLSSAAHYYVLYLHDSLLYTLLTDGNRVTRATNCRLSRQPTPHYVNSGVDMNRNTGCLCKKTELNFLLNVN